MPITSSTSVKLDTKTKERVQRLAALRRRSPHWVLREAVEQYVEREEQSKKFRQDGLAAWTNYQATALYVTAGEADKWLAKLEAGKDAPRVPHVSSAAAEGMGYRTSHNPPTLRAV
ncbi:MAG: ribbon-helix-helix protein, CopG family [Acidobacteriaceae bacterium]